MKPLVEVSVVSAWIVGLSMFCSALVVVAGWALKAGRLTKQEEEE